MKTSTHSMRRTVLVYGLIAGVIVSALMTTSIALMSNKHESTSYGMLIGYASMLLAFCFIFIAIKNYRDRQQGGVISFGKAFQTGLGVAVIASLCYTITWVIVYKNFYPEFLDQMFANELVSMQKKGESPAAIAKKTDEMQDMKAIYKTWPGLIGFTLLEILPLGLLIAQISAAILKRKPSPLMNGSEAPTV